MKSTVSHAASVSSECADSSRSQQRTVAADRLATLAVISIALVLAWASAAAAAETLDTLRGWISGGRAAEAETQLRTLLAAEENGESLQAAEVLDLLVDALFARGAVTSPECLEFAGRAVAIRERLQGAQHAELGTSLTRLGNAERASSRLDPAREHLERALAILNSARGASDPSTSSARMSLATLYTDLGEYARARELFSAEIASLERTRGREHRDLLNVLFNAGRAARRAGDYDDADTLYGRALAIASREYGSESLRTAYVLNGLANLRDDQARYAEARELYERALRIGEGAVGPDDPFVASCVNNLALVLKRLGDYDAAAQQLRHALDIERRARNSDPATTARVLANLAEVEGLRGNVDEALTLVREARTLREGIYDSPHPEIAGVLTLEASLELQRGDAKGAVDLYEKALPMAEATLGPDHVNVADLRAGLADALRESGEISRARSVQQQAVLIYERAVGGDDPRTADALRGLAALDALTGDHDSAMNVALRADRISREHARLTIGALAETEALRYAQQREKARDLLLTLLSEAPGSAAADDVWTAVIRARSLVLDEIAARHRSLAMEGGARTRALAKEYAATSQRLAELLVSGPGADAAAYRTQVDAARHDRDEIERRLASLSASFRARRAHDRIGLDEIRAAIPAGTALVAYSRYLHGISEPSDSGRYVAFVLPGRGPAAFVPLGDASEVESRVAAWVEEASQPDPGAGRAPSEHWTATQRAGEELRRLVWDPVAARVGAARTVFVVPDGALHRVNFTALPSPSGGYLVDSGIRLHSLLAERDLVRASEPRRAPGRGLLVVGGVEFSRAAAGTVASFAPARRFHFEPLPATADEARSVAKLWPKRGAASPSRNDAIVLTGAEATEGAVKRLAPGRRVIHIATHGIFLDATPPAHRSGDRGIGSLGVAPTPAVAGGGTPLLPLSGLAFAGANEGTDSPQGEDGILTAEEIASLDLSGTEWVVLSACDTGRGEVRPGEGVLGLRRAFQVSGVETLILSLWSVEDEPTRQWMEALYEARLARDLGTLESVDRANRTALAERRAKGESDHPFYWAAFVAAGDWR